MKKHEILNTIEKLIDESKVGVMASICKDGKPHVRWMTPTTLKGRPGVIFAVTAPGTCKTEHISENPDVEWMFQNKTLNEIVQVRGRVNLLENPSIKAEVMQILGKRLQVFWKINEETDFVVLETVIEEAEYFHPIKGIKETVVFKD